MRIAKRAGFWIVLLIVIASICQPAAADSSGSRWFPLTRHFVQGEFLEFYQSAPDPLTLFGYPITDAFADETGRLTQYFQRARFELVMTDKGPAVILAKLGWMLHENNGAPPNFIEDPLSCRMFPATGKNVCYAFLQFYDGYHGELYFGNPITGAEIIDGRIVQYFENVRMEYLMNRPEGHRVILTKLGVIAFEKYVNDPSLTSGFSNFIPTSPQIEKLTARAYVKHALVSRGMEQIVYLVLQDQDLQPVKDVKASVTVVLPDGSRTTYPSPATTGEDGILKIPISINLEQLAPRQVVIVEITAEYQNMKAKTATWFRIWY